MKIEPAVFHQYLLAVVDSRVDDKIRVEVVRFLLSQGRKIPGVAQRIRFVARSQNPQLRTWARLLIANLDPNGKESIDLMLRALAERNPGLRRQVVKSLALNAGKPRVRAYLRWMQHDEDEGVRAAAQQALR